MYLKSKSSWILYCVIFILILTDFSKLTTSLSFEIKASKDARIQVFYDSFINYGGFREKYSEKKDVRSGEEFSKLTFCIRNIIFLKRIRIDLGTSENEFYLKDLKIKSQFLDYDLEFNNLLSLIDFNKDIINYKSHNNILSIDTINNDPYFIIKNQFYNIILYGLLINFILSLIISFLIILLIFQLQKIISKYQYSNFLKRLIKKLDSNLVNEKVFVLFITIIFFIIALYGSLNHEMWRDELEMYSKYKFGNYSFTDIFLKTYSYLYHFIFSSSLFNVKLYHVLISTVTVFLSVRYSPFSQLQKILFVFSYFVLYEYTIISRSYGFTVLLFFLIIVLLTRKRIRYVPVFVVMLLLAKHNLYGVILSFTVLLYLIIKAFKERTFKIAISKKRKIVLFAFILLLFISSGFILKNYSEFYMNRMIQVEHLLSSPFFNTIRTIWTAFFPIPDLTSNYNWDTNIISFLHNFNGMEDIGKTFNILNIIAFIFSIGFIYFVVNLKFQDSEIKISFLIGLFLFLMVYQFVGMYFVRYIGLIFILFIAYSWISRKETSLFGLLLYIILIVQFSVGVYFYLNDIKKPFTASHQAANYIELNHLNEKNIIVGRTDYHSQSVSILLNTPIYYPQIEGFATHVEWTNSKRNRWISVQELEIVCNKLSISQNKGIIVIINTLIEQNSEENASRFKLIESFESTMIESEKYYIYSFNSD